MPRLTTPDPSVTLNRFAGIDNVSDQLRISLNARLVYLKTAINVDIDDNRMLHRRPGREKVYSGTPRCFWPRANIGISFALFLEGTNLKQLNPDYTTKTLLTGLDPDSDMDFVYVNGRVYYTNGTLIGYIKNEIATPFISPSSDKQFKRTLRAGTLIEYYRSRLYTALGNVMSFSDATRFYRMDLRYNAKQFDGPITMMKSVLDGIYVSAGNKTYFLSGPSPEKMVPIKVTGSPAFPGSAVTVENLESKADGTGYTVYWESEEGIFSGTSGGQVKNLTGDKYTPYILPSKSCAIYRAGDIQGQYIRVFELPERLNFIVDGRFPMWRSAITIS